MIGIFTVGILHLPTDPLEIDMLWLRLSGKMCNWSLAMIFNITHTGDVRFKCPHTFPFAGPIII
jgi:hypothetical protein